MFFGSTRSTICKPEAPEETNAHFPTVDAQILQDLLHINTSKIMQNCIHQLQLHSLASQDTKPKCLSEFGATLGDRKGLGAKMASGLGLRVCNSEVRMCAR